MTNNFDLVINRRNPNTLNKWTMYPNDVLPMWVADMDFRSPKPILDMLHRAVDHGIFGYELVPASLKETVAARMDQLYRWKVQPEAVIAVTGIVSGFSVAAREFCTPNRGLMIQTPVYNEFHEVKNNVGIPQIDAPLIQHVDDNILSYDIDWDVFEKQVRKAGIFLLCNPHNPLGIIFSRKDLRRMAEICIKHEVLIVSDEIHSELLLAGNQFTPMATLSKEIARSTITLIAPSKTFNVPGLFCGFAIVPDKELRIRYQKQVDHLRLHVSSMGLFAARVAFSGRCDGWLDDLRRYLTANRDFLLNYVTENMPDVKLTIPQATYLAWLDFSAYRLKKSPYDFFLKQARVALSDGKIFGKGSEGFVRLNFGCPRSILEQGLGRMKRSLRTR
ncbi:MAG TPA: MalY/PatB family protein [Anaerolineales bacterium]|nr:MalY/PatB family protein [Anaerolineales bacterium]